jgi:phosphatidylinositol-3-phosphatase
MTRLRRVTIGGFPVSSSRFRLLGAALLAGAAMALAACSAPAAPGASAYLGGPCARHGSAVAAPCGPASPTGVPQFRHIVVAAFDGKSYSQVIGNPSARFFNSLATGGADFTQSFAEASPGQPNYLALFSGSTQGVTTDSCPHTFTGPNLGADLIAAGHTFTGYAENLPAAGSTVCTSGNYARKHAPWTDFPTVPASASKPFTSFPQTSSGNFAALPTVSFVVPNICDSMTTCGVGTGNAWLNNRLGAYAQWGASNDSLLIVTFGHNDGTAGNQIATIFYGANVVAGNYSEHINHYNVLRTIEDAYGLPHDGAAASATPITDVWSGASSSPSPSVSASPSPSVSPTSSAAAGLPQFQHVVIVMFENHGYSQVIGSASAPYINQLAATGASFTRASAETHPSQPNYLALFSGSTQGVTSDACPNTFAAPNLAQGLIAAGKTFGGYVDALPAAGATVCTSGNYARKHVPWVNFSNVPASVTRSFTSFPQAGGNFAGLPDVSFVIPDLCNDMHNCPVATGDAWLSAHMGAYATWARSNDSLLIVTFDENEGTTGNGIPMVFTGAHVATGNYGDVINHYSLLRMLEDEYGLPHDGAAATAAPITGVWTAGS